MNEQEQKELKKGILLTASYYGRDLSSEVVVMMADDLSDLPFSKLSIAFEDYRRNPKNRTFPLPAQIREMIEPASDPQSQSRELVDRIKIAIRDFGWNQAEEARSYLGPLAWQVVRGMGGWSSVCESDFIFNPGLIAQARNRAEDLVKYEGRSEHLTLVAPPKREQVESSNSEVRDISALLAIANKNQTEPA